AERQHRAPPPRAAIKGMQTLAKRVENGSRDTGIHVQTQRHWGRQVPYLFFVRPRVNYAPQGRLAKRNPLSPSNSQLLQHPSPYSGDVEAVQPLKSLR